MNSWAGRFQMAFGIVLLVAVMSSLPLLAHHGTSVSYDMKRTITLKGTVTEFVWANPHVQLYFDVKDDKGHVANWGGEFMNPSRMVKLGWTKTSLKPGDEITITLFPNLLNKNFGNVANVVLENGQKLVAISAEEAATRTQIRTEPEKK
jgi:hypothetical protein